MQLLFFLCVWVNECSSGFRQAELAPRGVQLRWAPAIGCISLATQPSPHHQPPTWNSLMAWRKRCRFFSCWQQLSKIFNSLEKWLVKALEKFRPVPNGSQWHTRTHATPAKYMGRPGDIWHVRELSLVVVDCCRMLLNVVECCCVLKAVKSF